MGVNESSRLLRAKYVRMPGRCHGGIGGSFEERHRVLHPVRDDRARLEYNSAQIS